MDDRVLTIEECQQTFSSFNAREHYSLPASNTTSATDAYKRRFQKAKDSIKKLREESEAEAEHDQDLIPINPKAASDAEKLLKTLLFMLPIPEIDWEEEEGFINLSWRISSDDIISAVIRGNGHVIFSGVFADNSAVDGYPTLDKAPNILITLYETYS